MRRANIQHYCNDSQYRFTIKDGSMSERIFTAFVRDLINEYAKPIDGTFRLSINDLPSPDLREYLKQLFFYQGNLDCWEDIIANPSTYPCYLDEERSVLQYFIDQHCDDVYQDIQESMGRYSELCDQTGERMWRAY